MKKFIFFICIALATKCYAQSDIIQQNVKFNTYFWLGEIAAQNENYETAIHDFDSASDIFPEFHKPYFEAGRCAALLGDSSSAYSYFVKMIATGCPTISILPDYLGDFPKTVLYQNLIQKQDSLYHSGLKAFNINFIDSLQAVYDYKNTHFRRGVLDTVALQKFIEVCEHFGAFPSYKNVGMDYYRHAVFGILTNSLFAYDPESPLWKEFSELLHKEFYKGGVEAWVVGMIEDMDCYKKQLPQKYGCLTYFNLPDILYPDLETLNRNRQNIGLAPFEFEMQARNINIDFLKQ